VDTGIIKAKPLCKESNDREGYNEMGKLEQSVSVKELPIQTIVEGQLWINVFAKLINEADTSKS
jgi:hypothetical protein